MPRAIYPRKLIVTLNNDANSSWIEYKLLPADDEPVPDPLCRRVTWQALTQHLDAIRRRVNDLLELARLGRGREGLALEDVTDPLCNLIMPETGFAEVLQLRSLPLQVGLHPWFIPPSQPVVAALPWECFRESYWYCNRAPSCVAYRRPRRVEAGSSPYCCPDCGGAVRVVNRRLGLNRHLMFRAEGESGCVPAAGKKFLIVADPTEDFCDPENDPGRVCTSHLETLYGWIVEHGYQPVVLRGMNATVEKVKAAIRDPSIVGLYYFGHGQLPNEGEEGCLRLADHEPLYVSDIIEQAPAIPFVFLNGCHVAAVGRQREPGRQFGGVAQAFARGRGKVVIAPIWPVLSAQAATIALEFFRKALKGRPLRVALQVARRRSHRRYLAGEADIAWASYRYLGHTDRVLPPPRASEVEASDAQAPKGDGGSRVFNAGGQLDSEMFGFDCEEVLFRAAKRRLLQDRERASGADFIAGLIRKGALTRSLFVGHGLDPDGLYAHLMQAPDPEAPRSAAAAARQAPEAIDWEAFLSDWKVADESKLRSELIRVLVDADRNAQAAAAGGTGPLVSERDVLESLVSGGQWQATAQALRGVGFPSATEMRAWLGEADRDPTVDENGRIRLDDLAPRARKAVETAHVLAQQRGARPIPNRLMLTGLLLADAHGLAARLCARQGVHAETLAALMIASTEGDVPEAFPLSSEAGQSMLLPVLHRARVIAREEGSAQVEEPHLLRAFCQASAPRFRESLKNLPRPWRLDLEALATAAAEDDTSEPPDVPPADGGPADGDPADGEGGGLSLARFDPTARELMRRGLMWAQVQGGTTIRNPHVFASLIGQGDGPVGLALRHNRLDPEAVKQSCLLLVPPTSATPGEEASRSALEVSESTKVVLKDAVAFAERHGRSKANANDILRAFFAGGGGIVGSLLKKQGVDLQTWINIYAPDPNLSTEEDPDAPDSNRDLDE